MARTFYFPNIIRKTTIAFMSLFKDIEIAKYEADGTTIEASGGVPITFGTKQKFIANLNKRDNADYNLRLPRLGVILTGLKPNKSKSTGAEITPIFKYSITEDSFNNMYGGLPYTLSFTVSILSMHMLEVNQILEQILPYFSPHRTITIKEFDFLTDFTRNIKVQLIDTSPDFIDVLGDEDINRILWDLNFEIDIFLYKPILTSDIIKTIKAELLDTTVITTSGNLVATHTYAVSGSNIDDYIEQTDAWTEIPSGG